MYSIISLITVLKRRGTYTTAGRKSGPQAVTCSAQGATTWAAAAFMYRACIPAREWTLASHWRALPSQACTRANGGCARLRVPTLEVGKLFFLTISLISFFSDTMWVILAVVGEGTMQLTQQLSHLSDLGSIPPPAALTPNPFTQQRSHSTADVQVQQQFEHLSI